MGPFTAQTFRLPNTQTFTLDAKGYIRKDAPIMVSRPLSKSAIHRMRSHLREMGIKQGDAEEWPTSMIATQSEATVSKRVRAAKRKQYSKLMSDMGFYVMEYDSGDEFNAKLAQLVEDKSEPKKKLGRPRKLQRM
jgi:hypothetical protein